MQGFIRKRVFFYLIALLILTYFYRNILQYQYIWDDKIIFVYNTSLLQGKLSWQLLAQPVLEGSSYFRPLVFLSWFLEFNLFGQHPAISHLINLGFFYLNVLLVYHLILLSFANSQRRYMAAWIGGLIYLCHPRVVEATAWVSGRFDTFVTTFILLAYIGFLAIRRPLLRNLWVLACAVLALGSKELGILLVFGLYPVWMLRYYQPEVSIWQGSKLFWQKNYPLILCCILLNIGYLLVRSYYASGLNSLPMDNFYIHHYFLDKPVPILAFKEYIIRTVLPFYNMGEFIPIDYFSNTKEIWLSVLFFIGFWGVFFVLCKKRMKIIFPVLNYLLFISLVLYIVPIGIGGNLVQDRFLTLPLAFFSLTIAYTVVYCPAVRLRKYLPLSYIVYLLLISLISLQIIPNWKSPNTFWYAMNSYQKHYRKFSLIEYLNTLVQNNDHEGIEKYIEEERKINYGGLRPSIQVIYGLYLVFNYNPEGLDALRALIETLPDSQKKIANFDYFDYPLERSELQTLYTAYAYGVLQMEDDPVKAKHFIDIAVYHRPNYFSFTEKPVLVLILLAQDKVKEAKKILKEVKEHDYNGNMNNIDNLASGIKKYCATYSHPVTMCKPDFDIYKVYKAL